MSDHQENNKLNLPRDLGEGLTLRRATPADKQAVIEFDSRIFAEDNRPNESVANWIADAMSGEHPTVQPSDFTVVVDEKNGGKIVSSLHLISQTWTYDGIAFGVGRPEAVATAPQYRQKRLVARQLEVLHAESAARGHMLQAITGIPYYYRQYGYEMTVNLSGARRLYWHNVSKLEPGQTEVYRLRPATENDLALLQQLYEQESRRNLLAYVREPEHWRYELNHRSPKSDEHREFRIIEELSGTPAGYLALSKDVWPKACGVTELAVQPGQSWRSVCQFLTRALEEQATQKSLERARPAIKLNEAGEPVTPKPDDIAPYLCFSFALGAEHPAYVALDPQLEKPVQPYAWYIRVADLPAFMRHIAPALERRLPGSVMENHSGTLRLNFYRSQMTLVFEHGKIVEVGTYQPKNYAEGDAAFPDLTFLKLLFGHRSLADLRHADADCYPQNATAEVLLNILFPVRASNVLALE